MGTLEDASKLAQAATGASAAEISAIATVTRATVQKAQNDLKNLKDEIGLPFVMLASIQPTDKTQGFLKGWDLAWTIVEEFLQSADKALTPETPESKTDGEL